MAKTPNDDSPVARNRGHSSADHPPWIWQRLEARSRCPHSSSFAVRGDDRRVVIASDRREGSDALETCRRGPEDRVRPAVAHDSVAICAHAHGRTGPKELSNTVIVTPAVGPFVVSSANENRSIPAGTE